MTNTTETVTLPAAMKYGDGAKILDALIGDDHTITEGPAGSVATETVEALDRALRGVIAHAVETLEALHGTRGHLGSVYASPGASGTLTSNAEKVLGCQTRLETIVRFGGAVAEVTK